MCCLGFTNITWKIYQKKILDGEKNIRKLNRDMSTVQRFNNSKIRHNELDFYLPHELGGLGETIDPKYQDMNIVSELMEIPEIKPRSTIQKVEKFSVNIEQPQELVMADMKMFQNEDPTVIELRKKIAEKLEEL